MSDNNPYMQRCFELAQKGLGEVAPNPMVGAVIVKDNKVIGEGFHEKYGESHAEVNAINSVSNKSDLKGSTLYVNLEPCDHHGQTPPCTKAIIESGISEVVFSGSDPNENVKGGGSNTLRKAGIKVQEGIDNEEESWLNRRFITYHHYKRPYIILKWAQTEGGFMDVNREEGEKGQVPISNEHTKKLLHEWRTQEQAIMVGTNTALIDNPSLTARMADGKNPLRLVVDLKCRLEPELNLFTDGQPTVVYSECAKPEGMNAEWVVIDVSKGVINEILNDLYKRKILSVIVEGGKELLTSFIDLSLWDEARIFKAPLDWEEGLKAPRISGQLRAEEKLDDNRYELYTRL